MKTTDCEQLGRKLVSDFKQCMEEAFDAIPKETTEKFENFDELKKSCASMNDYKNLLNQILQKKSPCGEGD